MDASTLQFFQNIRLDPLAGNWIDQQLLANFPAAASLGPWPVEPSGCPLADIGNYILRVLNVLATFAEYLVTGDIIASHIDNRMQELVAENDLHTANALDDKHAALRTVTERLNKVLGECKEDWAFTLSTPQPTARQAPADPVSQDYGTSRFEDPPLADLNEANLGSNMYGAASENSTTPGQDLASRSWGASSQVSPGSSEDPNTEAPSIELLKARGKGRYTCPHGTACKKGGVQSNGQLTVYERNSAFRAHLQLHERTFWCDIPGCTNKKGFARIDQLERHKATVRHSIPSGFYMQSSS